MRVLILTKRMIFPAKVVRVESVAAGAEFTNWTVVRKEFTEYRLARILK